MRCRVVVAIVCLLSTRALAEDFFTSSPDKLARSHAALDIRDKCSACHIDDSKKLSNKLCLGCHDHQNLDERIKAGVGYHATDDVRGKNCETCHHEHKGRDYDLMGWSSVPGGMTGFDHRKSGPPGKGWTLDGAHVKTPCADCHRAKNQQGLRTFMGASRSCGNCHKADQPHNIERDALLACERCHTESLWKPQKRPMRFDHDSDTPMPLLGSHQAVNCTKCHPKALFNLPSKNALSCGNAGCHQSPHAGHLFDKRTCDSCHSPTFKALKVVKFDHRLEAHFELGASHSPLKCERCHTTGLATAKPNPACESCHAKDNKHGRRFDAFGSPPACAVCHPTSTFKRATAFQHGKQTKFALTYEHAKLSCRQCHTGSGVPNSDQNFTRQAPYQQCMSCHEHRLAHAEDKFPNGRYKNEQCLECHLAPGSKKIRVDSPLIDIAHDEKTGTFPLVDGHKKVGCNDCHASRDRTNKTGFSSIPADCDAAGQCHDDSLHQGELGESCESCHRPGIWKPVRFDHDKPFPKDAKGPVASYPLEGAHRDNKCEACHPQKKFAQANVNCADAGCHAKDDAHKGRLGRDCAKCHLETGDNTFNHNTMSTFRLDGKHLTVRCADCHASITFKPRPTDCFGCHPEPAVHKNQYGTGCAQCHTTRTWGDVKPLHDVGDFALKGAHGNIACERCHRDNRPLAGSGNLCLNCHKQDDIHSNSLSPKCGDCHTQWSFAPARFDHTRVGCNLTGLHRTIACFDCHKNGNFAAVSANCVGCHHDDDLRAGPQRGSINGGMPTDVLHGQQAACAGCHNPNTWVPANSFGRESVCR